MARRRSLSTTISTDKAVHQLATIYGDFAVMLYTWMIPHAEDDSTITGDPFEIAAIVIPTRRDKTEDDISVAIDGMVDVGLLRRLEGGRLEFPTGPFYKHQSYIPVAKRRTSPDTETPAEPTPQNTEDQRESPESADEQRDSPQIPASPSPSPSPSPTTPSGRDSAPSEPVETKPTREPTEAYQLVAAIMALKGQTPNDLAGDKGKQINIATRVLKKHPLPDALCCVAWLASDPWHEDKGIDAGTVDDYMTRWIQAGRPSARQPARASPNGKPLTPLPRYARPFADQED